MRRRASGDRSCNTCGEIDLSKLVPDKNRPMGVRNMCLACRRQSQRGGPTKNSNLKRTYGIDLNQYNQMLSNQRECCLICNRHRSELPTDLHVDHCHKTGKVRGLLCFNCNQGLGNFKDSAGLIISASEYLKSFG